MTTTRLDHKAIRRVLKPDRTFKTTVRVGGPIDLLQLRHDIEQRIRPAGGRPSDPSWDCQRLIRFKSAVWQDLKDLSRDLGSSPGHLAAMLIEHGVKAIKKRRR